MGQFVYEIVGAEELLKSLRWAEDMVVVSPDTGERVWLKRCKWPDGRAGVTDCCGAHEPCEYHARLTHQAVRQVS